MQGRNEGGKGDTIPRAPESFNNVASTFFNTVHLLPKDFRFEHGGAKLVCYPGRHLTSLRPWQDAIVVCSKSNLSRKIKQKILLTLLTPFISSFFNSTSLQNTPTNI